MGIGHPRQNESQPCPFCGEHTLITIESRKTQNSRRRRKHCETCNKRTTTHEVSERFYKDAIKNLEIIGKIEKAFSDKPKAVKKTMCTECAHWSNRCAFDFPEAGGYFASECSMFTT